VIEEGGILEHDEAETRKMKDAAAVRGSASFTAVSRRRRAAATPSTRRHRRDAIDAPPPRRHRRRRRFIQTQVWYKDEGGREKCILLNISLEDGSGNKIKDRPVQLKCLWQLGLAQGGGVPVLLLEGAVGGAGLFLISSAPAVCLPFPLRVGGVVLRLIYMTGYNLL
jgi:hypothetical protein